MTIADGADTCFRMSPENAAIAIANCSTIRRGTAPGPFRYRRPQPARSHIVAADDGDGISPANRARIFQPFFTTRRDSGGTGMGWVSSQRSPRRIRDGALADSAKERASRSSCREPDPCTPETIIIGAGPAGLACAAALQQAGLQAICAGEERQGRCVMAQALRSAASAYAAQAVGAAGPADACAFPKITGARPSRRLSRKLCSPSPERAALRNAGHARHQAGQMLVETPGEDFAAANVIVASGIAGCPSADWPGKTSFAGRLLSFERVCQRAPVQRSARAGGRLR